MSSTCTQTIEILPKLLNHIDTEYMFDFETAENHYSLIHEIYYSQGPFANISKEGRKFLTNDIKYHMLLEDGKILIVRIIGTHDESKIVKDKQDKKRLRVHLSIDQTRNLNTSPLEQLFEQHLINVEKLVKDELLPNIVIPVAEKISNQKG